MVSIICCNLDRFYLFRKRMPIIVVRKTRIAANSGHQTDTFIFEKALLKVKWTKKTSESFVAAIRSYHMIFCEERATEIR